MAEEITKTMGADLKNFSSRLNISLEKSIAEAVVNSIHAQATDITVDLFLKDSAVSSIKITDNGEGFTPKNLDSFFVLHSDHKLEIGGKGVGRATWYRFFDNVHVESSFIEDGKIKHLCFNLPKKVRKAKVLKDEVDTTELKTSIELTSYTDDLNIGTSPITLKQFLLHELLMMLISKKQKGTPVSISIKSYEGDECVESERIAENDIPEVKKESFFALPVLDEKHDFKLLCIHVSTSQKNSVQTGFIAGERTIPSFESTLGLKIQAPTRSYTGKYIFLLESKLFNNNQYTTEGRDRVVLPEETDLWGNNFRQQLKGKITQLITAFFDEEAPAHVEDRKKVIEEIIEIYPQYSSQEYRDVIGEVLLESIGHVDKYDILKRLNMHDFTKEYAFKTELDNMLREKKIPYDAKEQTISLALKTSEQAKGVLANYFWYRKAIIDQLQKLRDDNEKSEDVLHDLFFERYETQMQASLKNCLWLLDDKFMSFSYFASEAVMRTVVDEIYGEHTCDHNSQKRADLFIKFNRPSEEDSIDCVVVEFKSLGATVDERSNAASQVRRKYASYLRKHIPNLNDIFIYIISELDEALCEDLKSDDFWQSYSRHGKIMAYYNKNNNAHIFFVGASTLVGDSKDRHELFFKLLKDEMSAQERLA